MPTLACNALIHNQIVLRLPAHIVDGTLILVSALGEIVAGRERYGNSVDQDTPVHGSRIGIRDRWEKQEDEGQAKEADGEDVDKVSPSTQREL